MRRLQLHPEADRDTDNVEINLQSVDVQTIYKLLTERVNIVLAVWLRPMVTSWKTNIYIP